MIKRGEIVVHKETKKLFIYDFTLFVTINDEWSDRWMTVTNIFRL